MEDDKSLKNADKLVSIVIPVYNVEGYVKTCVRSVMDQSYKTIEIIIVDDGSTDDSGKICKELSNEDSRIKVFHKENGGLSSARNYGVSKSSGVYLYFLDGDDEIHPDAIKTLVEAIVDSGSDMAVGGFQSIDENGKRHEIESNMLSAVLEGEGLRRYFFESDYNRVQMISACNKLYCLDKMRDIIVFPKGRLHEDEFIAHKVWLSIQRAVITDEPLYLYRKRSGSIMNNSRLDVKRLDATDALLERMRYTIEKAPEYTGYVWRNLIDMLYTMYCRGKETGSFEKRDFKTKYNEQLKEFKQIWKKIDKRYVSKKNRLISDVMCISPVIYMEKRRLSH